VLLGWLFSAIPVGGLFGLEG